MTDVLWTVPLLAFFVAIATNALARYLAVKSSEDVLTRLTDLEVEVPSDERSNFKEDLERAAMVDSDRIQLLTLLLGVAPLFVTWASFSSGVIFLALFAFMLVVSGAIYFVIKQKPGWNGPRKRLFGQRPLFIVVLGLLLLATVFTWFIHPAA